jgi:hypothetical protein
VLIAIILLYTTLEGCAKGVRGFAVSVSDTAKVKLMQTMLPHLVSAGFAGLGGAILPGGLGGDALSELRDELLCASGWSNSTCAPQKKDIPAIKVYSTDGKDSLCSGLDDVKTVSWKECDAVCASKGLICRQCKSPLGVEKCIGHQKDSIKLSGVAK